MYLIIAYHGKGKEVVEEDLKKLWFNYANFVKHVDVKHMYFFQNAKDDSGANLLMIIEYKCRKACFDASGCSFCGAGTAKQTLASRDKSVNYWLYVRENKKITIEKMNKQGGLK